MNQEAVQEYGENLDKLPPGVVYVDSGAKHWLAGGRHTYEAYKARGATGMPCDVRPGEFREALLYAVGDNATHGLRRTTADKRKAVLTLLEVEEFANASSRTIADHCRVSHPFVEKIRAETATGNVTSSEGDGEKRTGRDGKERSMPVNTGLPWIEKHCRSCNTKGIKPGCKECKKIQNAAATVAKLTAPKQCRECKKLAKSGKPPLRDCPRCEDADSGETKSTNPAAKPKSPHKGVKDKAKALSGALEKYAHKHELLKDAGYKRCVAGMEEFFAGFEAMVKVVKDKGAGK